MREEVSRQGREDLGVEMSGDNLAYVIYTSGTTGRPKGVCIPHRAISRLVLNTNYVRFEPGDKVAQVSSVSFDAAIFEVWGGLLNGGEVVVIGTETLLSPGELGEKLRRAGVDVMFMTTSLFNQVVKQEPRALATVRDVVFGGEAGDVGALKNVLEGGGPPRRLINGYGPTEGTTFASWYEVREGAKERARYR